MKIIKIFVVISMLAIGAFFCWSDWFNNELKHPDIPALRLNASQQNVYPQPASMASIILYFENDVTNTQEFANRVLRQKGVTKLFQSGKNTKVFEVRFDPGYTDQGQLLAELYPAIDDPRLFTK
jgi:hypothetical protein